MKGKLPVSSEVIREYCTRWKIVELALFGSVLREDFSAASDIDVLVTFAPEARWTLFDLVRMKEELKSLFQREVDLVSRRGLESSRNAPRRKAIFESAEIIYAA